jgi:hypothetical protein
MRLACSSHVMQALGSKIQVIHFQLAGLFHLDAAILSRLKILVPQYHKIQAKSRALFLCDCLKSVIQLLFVWTYIVLKEPLSDSRLGLHYLFLLL